MAKVAIEYFHASPNQTESILGFKPRAVVRGLQELEAGEPIANTPENRGRPRIEQQRQDIGCFTDAVLSENSQIAITWQVECGDHA